MSLTTFIISTIDRPTLPRAVKSTGNHPTLIGYDMARRGQGIVRNELIAEASTEWVSFLDDDDTVSSDYVDRLAEEIATNPAADCIHFREYFLRGLFIPVRADIEWGNIGISFSVKRNIALAHPFQNERYEDLHFIERLAAVGHHVAFSKYITYHVRH